MRDRRTLYVAATLLAAVALSAGPVHAVSDPTVVSIVTQGCANDRVCVTLTVDNPVAGTITLKLTGHTPGSSVFVDTGAELAFTIVPGTTTYTACFENVSSIVAGQDFNTLRVQFQSSDIPNLQGTTTPSVSFAPCTSTTTTSTTSTTTTSTTTTTTSTTTTTQPDHFQCYEVKPQAFPAIPQVSVVDQFGSHIETVRFPHRLCAPADKNG